MPNNLLLRFLYMIWVLLRLFIVAAAAAVVSFFRVYNNNIGTRNKRT